MATVLALQIRDAHISARRVNRGRGMPAIQVKAQLDAGEEVPSFDDVQRLVDPTGHGKQKTERLMDMNAVLSKAGNNGMIQGKMIRAWTLHTHFCRLMGMPFSERFQGLTSVAGRHTKAIWIVQDRRRRTKGTQASFNLHAESLLKLLGRTRYEHPQMSHLVWSTLLPVTGENW